MRILPPPVALALVPLLLTGCGADLEQLVSREGMRPEAVVRPSNGYAVAAMRDGARVRVTWFRDGLAGWTTGQLAESTAQGDRLVQLASMGGETGERWNSFVYGIAGPTVSRVELAGLAGEGGQVIDGAWVVALEEKDLAPRDVRWRFLAPDGAILEEGVGLLE